MGIPSLPFGRVCALWLCRALTGGCLAMRDFATGKVDGTEMSRNSALSEGAAASLTSAAALAIQGATLEGNAAASGGCFWLEMRTALNLSSCTFVGNTAAFVVRPPPVPLPPYCLALGWLGLPALDPWGCFRFGC